MKFSTATILHPCASASGKNAVAIAPSAVVDYGGVVDVVDDVDDDEVDLDNCVDDVAADGMPK